MNKLENYRHIHFVGIGGVSMHALALYCKDYGLQVSGSDINKNKYFNLCKSRGIKVCYKHKAKNINNADLVVHTGAINESNIEIVEARARGIEVVDRAELLAVIIKNFKCVIGVAGTHGKSTTSAMIYHTLKESGKRVSCHIGADVKGARLNPFDEYLVLECCEYNKSFLRFNCDVGIVLNIDNDHLDCYGNMYNLRNGFKTFIKKCKNRLVLDNETTKCLNMRVKRIALSKSISSNRFIYNNRKYVLNNVYGLHNIDNATACIEVCMELGLSYTKIYRALKTFSAVARRCEKIGEYQNCDVITDYAHHPKEIMSLMESLQTEYDNIVMIFQPHTYSRTRLLLYEFVATLIQLKDLIIYKEYSAREDKSQGCTAKELSNCLDNAIYVKNVRSLKGVLSRMLFKPKCCIVFVGAGDINEVAVNCIS